MPPLVDSDDEWELPARGPVHPACVPQPLVSVAVGEGISTPSRDALSKGQAVTRAVPAPVRRWTPSLRKSSGTVARPKVAASKAQASKAARSHDWDALKQVHMSEATRKELARLAKDLISGGHAIPVGAGRTVCAVNLSGKGTYKYSGVKHKCVAGPRIMEI